MSDQAYYWTPEWQTAEGEARAEILAGRSVTFGSGAEMVAWLTDEGDD